MTRSTDADTEDGSAATDSHEEPYVTKRSGSLTIEGRPIVDTVTGDRDAGQSMLNDYAEEQGWPERYTKKQIGRRFSMGSLRGSGLIETVMKLVTNSMRTDEEIAAVSDPDTAPAAETPEDSGN